MSLFLFSGFFFISEMVSIQNHLIVIMQASKQTSKFSHYLIHITSLIDIIQIPRYTKGASKWYNKLE